MKLPTCKKNVYKTKQIINNNNYCYSNKHFERIKCAMMIRRCGQIAFVVTSHVKYSMVWTNSIEGTRIRGINNNGNYANIANAEPQII